MERVSWAGSSISRDNESTRTGPSSLRSRVSAKLKLMAKKLSVGHPRAAGYSKGCELQFRPWDSVNETLMTHDLWVTNQEKIFRLFNLIRLQLNYRLPVLYLLGNSPLLDRYLSKWMALSWLLLKNIQQCWQQSCKSDSKPNWIICEIAKVAKIVNCNLRKNDYLWIDYSGGSNFLKFIKYDKVWSA